MSPATSDTASRGSVLKVLLLSDLVDSTKLVERLGDAKAFEVFGRHDRMARDLLAAHAGREIDKTDGFLLLFDRPIDAVGYALAYHRGMVQLGAEAGVPMASRVGIHLGEVYLRETPAEDVARGAKPVDVEGLAKPIAARLMSLGTGGQTLLTRTAFEVARRASVGVAGLGAELEWVSHGAYRLKGVEEPMEVFEVGVRGLSPLAPPPDGAKASRVAAGSSGVGAAPLAHYQILDRLGGGGMGVVFEAEDKRLGRRVAVKFLSEKLAGDRESLERFLREARAASALNHPNICTIHDLGEQDGKPFIVMELLKGRTLEDEIGGRPLPLARVLELGVQIADALEAAHAHGIVHRDVKPANVIVTEHGAAKLLDFGLAKLATAGPEQPRAEAAPAAGTAHGAGLTGAGVQMGTAGFMSPEQAQGAPVDARGDLYSFGVTLNQMATGRLPAEVPGGMTAASTRREGPDRPDPESGPAVRRSAPSSGIDVDLGRIIDKALEPDPALRYQSAAEMKADLKRLQRDTGSSPTMLRQAAASRWATRAKGIAVGLAVLAIAAGLVWRYGRAPAPATDGIRRIAVLPFENLGAAEDLYFADGMTDEVRSRLASLPGLAVIARSSADAYKGTTKTPSQIAEELGVTYLLTAKVRWQKGATGASRIRVSPELVEVRGAAAPTARWQDSYDAVLEDVFRVQGEIATRVAGSLQVALGAQDQKRLAERPTADLAAYDAYLRGQDAAADLDSRDPTALARAIAQYEQAVKLDPGFALAWAQLSRARSLLIFSGGMAASQGAGAQEAAERALGLAPALPEAHIAKSLVLTVVSKDGAKALDQCLKGLSFAPNHAGLLTVCAVAETSLGRWESVVEHLQAARRLDPRSPQIARRLGASLQWLRRYPEALDALDRGLVFSPADLALIEARAMVFLSRGDLAGARAALASVPKEVEANDLLPFVAMYWDLTWVLDEAQQQALLALPADAFGGEAFATYAFAQVHAQRGDVEQTRKWAELAEKGLAAQLAEAPDDAPTHVSRGVALAYLGRKEEAIAAGKRAMELEPLSRDAYGAPYLQHQVVRIYTILGEREKAMDLLEPLLARPYYLSPAWLGIDPTFAPLKGDPRFEKLMGARR